MPDALEDMLADIRACRVCAGQMRRAPNPILQASSTARVLIVGQAPGNLADVTGTPFNDPSGDRLRDWMGVTREEFYDARKFALVPMGFCFPGYDENGSDIPPMRQCAIQWRAGLMEELPVMKVTLLVGGYAQRWHLKNARQPSVTETVRAWRDHAAGNIYPTPHPSWRNTGWLKRNPWFEAELLPHLRASIRAALRD